MEAFSTEGMAMSYQPGTGIRGEGSQFTIFFPRFRISPEEVRETVCDWQDELLLTVILAQHFGGYTVDEAFLQGAGPREGKPETNLHRKITVIAARSPEAIVYFQMLCKELQECSGEEQVFLLQQDIIIL
ncbi:MAG TPA: hypothetical protein VHZ04_01555 [Candidatus Paceibacterota bacterium]|jgi:hypothetical protein|nr:hypothetical protein [Candidatus Paceibacterota bacterium]